jgi:hypothetical protein
MLGCDFKGAMGIGTFVTRHRFAPHVAHPRGCAQRPCERLG